jgi:hypothetical protein
MACPKCSSTDVRRAESGLVYDDYVCRSCDHSYSIISPTAKRSGVVLGVTLLTGGLDFGLLGGAVAWLFDANR